MINLYTQKAPRRRYVKSKYYITVKILHNRDGGMAPGGRYEGP